MIGKKTVAIIGGGPSAMMLAAHLDNTKFDVTIYERNHAPGRKFLVAGDGGFNLTHAEPVDQFITRYTPPFFLEKTIAAFSNKDLTAWLKSIGIPTYEGSSKRIFPLKPIKPIAVLNAILNVLMQKNVILKNYHTWVGWSDAGKLLFSTKDKDIITVSDDVAVFAMGGASWRKTGSDGSWISYFAAKEIDTLHFQPSNCAVQINWPPTVLKQLEGQSLKNISIKCSDKEKKGEVVITAFGLEGGAVYALAPQIRDQLQQNNKAMLYVDLKPAFTIAEILKKLQLPQGRKSWTKYIEDQLHLNKVQLNLIKNSITKEEFLNAKFVAEQIKALPLQVTALAAIDEAISTVGGIALHEIDSNFQLKKMPGNYVIGEMLNWDAPTGGYLLQACFSMGYQLAQKLNNDY